MNIYLPGHAFSFSQIYTDIQVIVYMLNVEKWGGGGGGEGVPSLIYEQTRLILCIGTQNQLYFLILALKPIFPKGIFRG